MPFHLSVILSLVAILFGLYNSAAQPLLGKTNGPVEIAGQATNGLQPHFLVEQYKSGWSIEIDLYAQTNFEPNAWLKITNREGSKLQCWLTNGTKLSLTNPSSIAASKLPLQTTVSTILKTVRPRDRRGLQWWPVAGRAVDPGFDYPMATFGVPFTNDVVLQIAPLIYKVDTNGVTAHLVEFPAAKLKLTSDGKVEQIR